MWRLGILRQAAVGLGAAVAVACGGPAAHSGSDAVDLALILAVDVSISMDATEGELQRRGYAAAFRDETVISAFTSGPHGRIAVAFVEWGGTRDQHILIDWTLIDGAAAATATADRLDDLPRGRGYYTAIGEALRFSTELMTRLPYRASRQVIDISGDGVNNEGLRVDIARDLATGGGIVINGLPLILEDDGRITILDVPDLDIYYEDCVIGGPGAFSLPVRRKEDLAEAIRAKLLLEVAGSAGLVVPVTANSPRIPCDIGERRRGLNPLVAP